MPLEASGFACIPVHKQCIATTRLQFQSSKPAEAVLLLLLALLAATRLRFELWKASVASYFAGIESGGRKANPPVPETLPGLS